MAGAPPQAVGERLLALVTPQASSQRVVRRAWRSAQRLGAELDVLTVLAPGRPGDAEEREQLDALRRLGALLGAHVMVEEGDDVAEVAARVARERGTTYVLIGTPAPRRGLRRFAEPLTERLLRRLPGVDVRIVADRVASGTGTSDHFVRRRPPHPAPRPRRRRALASAVARRRAAATSATAHERADPVPVRRRRAVRARAAGGAAARARRAGDARARVPRVRADRARPRRAVPADVRRGLRGLRGDRAAGRARGRAGRRPDRARPQRAPRAAGAARRRARAARSSSRPRRRAARRLQRRRRRLAAAQRAARGRRRAARSRGAAARAPHAAQPSRPEGPASRARRRSRA